MRLGGRTIPGRTLYPTWTGPHLRTRHLWHTADTGGPFELRVRAAGKKKWRGTAQAESRRIAVSGVEPHRVWSAPVTGLRAGSEFEYQVLSAGTPVFTATSQARKSASQPHRFVVFGDCGQNSPEQKQIAYQTHLAKPDFIFLTGDLVYSRGRIPEYRERYFPVYSAPEASAAAGAPLLKSVLFAGAPGNHDIAETDFDKYPDGQAYYYYWKQPLNGPLGEPGKLTSKTQGSEANVKAFRDAAGSHYPRMANFSFDYGNAHWTVIDGNRYADWTDPALADWIIKDLRSASKAAWRFVGFHQPGFNSSKAHFAEQHMRVLAPIFEAHGVDVVFTGHVHNYQRSYPMKYDPATKKATLDRKFEKGPGRPNGVIYLVTGAGGARLYNPEQQDAMDTWQEFTQVFISKIHSFTVVDADNAKLTIRQIGADGKEVDNFVITKR